MTKHILIAEDEFLAAMLLDEILTEAGYRVTIAQNGERALQVWSRDKADLLLTDFAMPTMDGGELVRRLRAEARDLPIVMVTGYMELRRAELEALLGDPDNSVLIDKPACHNRILSEVSRLLSKCPTAFRGPAPAIARSRIPTAHLDLAAPEFLALTN